MGFIHTRHAGRIPDIQYDRLSLEASQRHRRIRVQVQRTQCEIWCWMPYQRITRIGLIRALSSSLGRRQQLCPKKSKQRDIQQRYGTKYDNATLSLWTWFLFFDP